MSFPFPVSSVIIDRSVIFATPEPEQDAKPLLVNQLFGSQNVMIKGVSWDQTIYNCAKSTVQAGLREKLRFELLSKFKSVKDDLLILGPPKLNKLLFPALKTSSTVAKRDEYQALAQTQVAAVHNAQGTEISCLTKSELASVLLAEGKVALSQIAKDMQLLADLQYRPSQAGFYKTGFEPAEKIYNRYSSD